MPSRQFALDYLHRTAIYKQSRDSLFYLGLLRVGAAPVCRPGYKYDGESSLEHLTYSPRLFAV